MRRSKFVFSVDLLYYELHKISPNSRGSYIDSPKWLKHKKATINPKNNNEKCFQYVLTVALNYQNMKKENPEKISKIKSFIDRYNWKEIDFSSHKKDCKKIELNNKSVAIDILFVSDNTKEIRHAYKSKFNFIRKNQVILLMITNAKQIPLSYCEKFACIT